MAVAGDGTPLPTATAPKLVISSGYTISFRRRGRTREPAPKWQAHAEIERIRYKLLQQLEAALGTAVSPVAFALTLQLFDGERRAAVAGFLATIHQVLFYLFDALDYLSDLM